MKNGRTAVKGKCPACGVVVFKIFDGKTPEVNAASDPVDFPESPDMPA